MPIGARVDVPVRSGLLVNWFYSYTEMKTIYKSSLTEDRTYAKPVCGALFRPKATPHTIQNCPFKIVFRIRTDPGFFVDPDWDSKKLVKAKIRIHLIIAFLNSKSSNENWY